MPKRLNMPPAHSVMLLVITLLIALILLLAYPRTVRAHGDWEHVHVTAWAIARASA